MSFVPSSSPSTDLYVLTQVEIKFNCGERKREGERKKSIFEYLCIFIDDECFEIFFFSSRPRSPHIPKLFVVINEKKIS